jgi:ribosomal-protein-alanine N-acetyltransferase
VLAADASTATLMSPGARLARSGLELAVTDSQTFSRLWRNDQPGARTAASERGSTLRTADEVVIRRPRLTDWGRILEILETANFHRIGSEEMPSFPLTDCFVADRDGRVIGVAGYRILTPTTAKTTLLAVDPGHRAGGRVGYRLQRARMDFLRDRGVETLTTNADDPRVIAWYERRFGYRRTGETVRKLEPFGRDDVVEWTTLSVDLRAGTQRRGRAAEG